MKLQTTSHSNVDIDVIKYNFIVDKVSSWHGLKPIDLFERRRFRPLVVARQELFYFVKYFCTKMSLASIGGLSSKYREGVVFDHATILHAVRTIENLMFTDKSFNSSMLLKTNSLRSELDKLIGEVEVEETFQEKINKLLIKLSELGETKEVELLLMYLNKLRDEREETDIYSFEDNEVEMV